MRDVWVLSVSNDEMLSMVVVVVDAVNFLFFSFRLFWVHVLVMEAADMVRIE